MRKSNCLREAIRRARREGGRVKAVPSDYCILFPHFIYIDTVGRSWQYIPLGERKVRWFPPIRFEGRWVRYIGRS